NEIIVLFSSQPVSLAVWCAPALSSDGEKTAMEGTSTTITCSYDRGRYKFSRKYWCHGRSRSSCDILGDTDNFVKSEYNGRLLLLDNKRGDFLVTMHQLVEEDSGMYWCGIQKPYADIMTAVKLTVTEGKYLLNIQLYIFITDGESYNCIRTTPVFTVEMPSTPFTGYSTPCSNSSSHPGTEE
uniref:Ig-like domain-containing protein n=1 Tax=Chrysemys picta bellii TaxID=8478 RepID=A0A8C3HPJ3_CHRPI